MEILYESPHFAICIKPLGMDSEHQLPQALSEQLGGAFYPIHRLDQNVGGVMVFARTKAAAAALSKAVQEGQLTKEYVAQVHGSPPESGDWEDLLFKDSRQNKVFVVQRERKGVKKARLTFRRLTDGQDALVRIRLYTGRSHQIRVQFASRGFPLLGDRKYGSRDDLTAPRLFSCRLTFPFGGETHQFQALPDWCNEANF